MVKKKANKLSVNRIKKKKQAMKWHAVPLKGSFMVLSIVGFFFSAYLVYPSNFNYGVAFMLVFTTMFIASLVSMTKAPIIEQ